MIYNVEETIYQFLYNDLSVKEFENWVYQSTELEAYLTSDDYLELISLNYKNKFVRNQIEHIITKYVDIGKFETAKLTSLLQKIIGKDDKTGDILRLLYHNYCNGYYFLHDIALGYGLSCEVPLSKYSANTWEELSESDQNSLINSFYPEIITHAEKVLSWIDNKKITLTGTTSKVGQWEYIDYRTPEEIKSAILVEKKSNVKKKTWWKFWK